MTHSFDDMVMNGYDKQLIWSHVEAEYSENLIHSVVSLLEMLFIKFNYHSVVFDFA